MPGTVLAVGVVICSAALVMGYATVGGAAAFSQRAASAADAAALAAADAALGAVSGVPCERAGEVAEEMGARLTDCRLDGLVATVAVSATNGPLATSVSARAGPPPVGNGGRRFRRA